MQRHRFIKRRWLPVIVLTLLVSLVFVMPVGASKVITKENVVIDADEVIDDDVVFTGSSLVVNGVIKGDLVAIGQEITVNGTVEGDLLAMGMTIIVNGEVTDDARAAGYLVRFGSGATVGDDAMAAGFSVEAESGSSVGSDMLVAGFQALLAGEIGGDLKGGANGIRIDGTVGGDAELEVGEPGPSTGFSNFAMFNPQMPPVASVPAGLTIGSGASIEGDLSYTSVAAGNIASGTVQGSTDFERQVLPEAEEPEFEFKPRQPGAAVQHFAGQIVLKLVRRFITLTLIGLLIIWLMPKLLNDTVAVFKARPWNSLGIGALGYAVSWVALFFLIWVLILLGTVLGIISLGGLTPGVLGFGAVGWAGLLVGFVTATSWLAKIVLGVWVGQIIWKAIQPEGKSLVPPLLIGVAIATALRVIPVLGSLFGFAVGLFGLGALIMMVRERLRPAEKPAAEAV
jgi:hypothetical protein